MWSHSGLSVVMLPKAVQEQGYDPIREMIISYHFVRIVEIAYERGYDCWQFCPKPLEALGSCWYMPNSVTVISSCCYFRR